MGGYFVPYPCLTSDVGTRYPPGYLSDARWGKVHSPPVSPCPFWAKPITRVGLFLMTAVAQVRIPSHIRLS